MSARINTNIEALNAQRNLSLTGTQFAKSVEKLSSGLRINRAADDAAGLAISEKLRAQVRGLNQAQRNAQDGISMVQTAEGALTEVHSMLQRMRELAVQSSNSTLSSADSQSVNTEIVALKAEIDRVTGATTFNGQYLLTGALGGSTVGSTTTTQLVKGDTLNASATAAQTVAGTGATALTGISGAATLAASQGVAQGALSKISVDTTTGVVTVTAADGEAFTGTATAGSAGAKSITLTGRRNDNQTIPVAQTTGNTLTLTFTELAGSTLASMHADLNAGTAVTVAADATKSASVTNISAPTALAATYTFKSYAAGTLTLTTGTGATLRSQTVNVADTAANGTQTLSFDQLGISVDLLANSGGLSKEAAISDMLVTANATIDVTGGAATAANFQIGANASDSLSVLFVDARTSNTSTTTGYGTLAASITTFTANTGTGNGIVAAAQGLITSVDAALSFISTTRGNFGAVQNRLEHTIASLGVASENLASSESRIRDLDVASEMVTFTKTQILQQAGTAILAQANQAPQSVLSLLR